MTKASVFLTMAWIGLAGIVLALAAFFAPADYGLAKIGALLTIVSGLALVSTRNADEYTVGLWNSGASLAVTSLILLLILMPFSEGLYDGFTGGETKQDLGPDIAIMVAIGAFYLGLFSKHIRGHA